MSQISIFVFLNKLNSCCLFHRAIGTIFCGSETTRQGWYEDPLGEESINANEEPNEGRPGRPSQVWGNNWIMAIKMATVNRTYIYIHHTYIYITYTYIFMYRILGYIYIYHLLIKHDIYIYILYIVQLQLYSHMVQYVYICLYLL